MDIDYFRHLWSDPQDGARGFLYDLCELAGASWRHDFASTPDPRAEFSRTLGLLAYVDHGPSQAAVVSHAVRMADSIRPAPMKVLASNLETVWFRHGAGVELSAPIGSLAVADLATWFRPLPSRLPEVSFGPPPTSSSGAETVFVPNRLGAAVPPHLANQLMDANARAAMVRGRRDKDSPSARAARESGELLATLLSEGFSTKEIEEATGMKQSMMTARLKLVTRLSVHQLRKQAFKS